MSERLNYNREGYLNENFRMFHLRDSAGQERDFHFHEFDKLVVLISGSVDYLVEGTTYSLKPHDVLLVRHHMIHKAVIDKSVPYERIIIYLNSAYIERFSPDSGLMDCFARAEKYRFCLIRPEAESISELDSTLARLEAFTEDSGQGAELLRATGLVQLMIYLNRLYLAQKAQDDNSAEHNQKIADALSYINENITAELSVDELARRSYLSRYHFMRQFKAQTGCTVHNYIRQKRLNLAARLIREGMTASQAAAECGFTDYSAFHRAFSQTFGVSPGKFKSAAST